jgi:carbamoyltransferase
MFLLTETTHRMIIQHDPDVGHRFVPNLRARLPGDDGGYFVVTNSSGFRSDFNFSAAPASHPRILMFGDSYTAGDNVANADRYSDQLSLLTGAEVQNYGVPGSGTDQHLLIYRKFAREIPADLVMICVQIDSFHRIQVSHRPSIDRITGARVLVPKPYFESQDGHLVLQQVPVPRERPLDEGDWQAAGKEEDGLLDRVHQLYMKTPGLKQLRHSKLFEEAGSRALSEFNRLRGAHPYPDILSDQTPGWQLMRAILQAFIAEVRQGPVVIVPVPTYEFYETGVEPVYQPLFASIEDRARGVHVCDVSTMLVNLPWATRQKLRFPTGGHFTPMANRLVAERMAEFLRDRKLIPTKPAVAVDAMEPSERRCPPADRKVESDYVLGISCFYHNSAAALIRDGQLVAAAEEERFTRVKNDRRFPQQAVNYCLEEAGIAAKDLRAVAFYDNAALTFERLCHSLMAVEQEPAERMWLRMVPSWVRMKLHFSRLVRQFLNCDVPVLQGIHHRSHAASCFYPSPFDQAAILTVDGVGEWATATIGRGDGRRIDLLKEMRFPHSLGLLYSAFTQFTGFKVNSGEYKMMGLAPYGEPSYVQKILDHVVNLKEDGSVELNLEHFAFLRDVQMTTGGFDQIFGGPKRRPEDRITRREIDLAKSIQTITEEAILRMARTAHRLTGEKKLCLAGGVALNCVANGRLLREGPFEDLWIQPAAGDSGCALGVALDVYHTYFERERKPAAGVDRQAGSYLGPAFSGDEIASYLDTFGYPYRRLSGEERNRFLVEQLKAGKVVGHFAGRLEYGPRSLGSRSILGDPRNSEMQASLNLRIKYRESFRPFAPAVLAERVGEYFELDRDSPYMLLVAPVKKERRLPLDAALGAGDDLLPVVRRLRSDLPAITHVDYSARVQTIRREHHPVFYSLVEAFEKETGCAVIVNTSFNVRGEPIVCTPQDAYRCFMRTEMDVLALGDYILVKGDQPAWPEGKGEGLENEDVAAAPQKQEEPEKLLSKLTSLFRSDFWPAARRLRGQDQVAVREKFRKGASTWEDAPELGDPRTAFELAPALEKDDPDPREFARELTRNWLHRDAAEALRPVIAKVVAAGMEHATRAEVEEKVSESVYVMF